MSLRKPHDEQARVHAQKQWNTNPCGALPTDIYDKEYFDCLVRLLDRGGSSSMIAAVVFTKEIGLVRAL